TQGPEGTEAQIPENTPEISPTPELIQSLVLNLNSPWEIAFLPDGTILITERGGNLIVLDGNEESRISIADVYEQGESGLLGLAVHPNFDKNRLIYLYLSYATSAGIRNRVESYQFTDEQISDKQILIDDIPGAGNHDGGRIEFGPDGLLYITTGDAQNPDSAQDINSLSGKILRLNDDGSIPSDNPFNNMVYSYGHRNPQGLAWDEEGRLWSTEHGPSGFGTGYDELNLIEMGGNYGWPVIQGDQTREGMISPRLHSGGNETWAPGDLEIVDGQAWFNGLRGSTLYSVSLDRINPESLNRNFVNQFGRLRAIRLGPDGFLYVGTSNRDGRGSPNENDDQIFKIDLLQLLQN
nr:PQQ-dependent sugar dehydrogenase [Anaerolineaceae bacterium]